MRGIRTAYIRHQPSLEAQVANLADEKYYNHDLDDGLESGLNENQLSASVSVAFGQKTR